MWHSILHRCYCYCLASNQTSVNNRCGEYLNLPSIIHIILLIRDGSIRDSTGFFEKNKRQQYSSRKKYETKKGYFKWCRMTQGNSISLEWTIQTDFVGHFLGKSSNKVILFHVLFKLIQKTCKNGEKNKRRIRDSSTEKIRKIKRQQYWKFCYVSY